MKRLSVYVPDDLARRIKALVALQEISLSEWFRRKSKEDLDNQDMV
jgi:hypothetical protein